MSRIWQTKYGPRRVRRDEPTIAEAINAAQGLTDDVDQQAEIAAALMAVPIADVRQEMAKVAAAPRRQERLIMMPAAAPQRPGRTVIVERKAPRRQRIGAMGA